MVITVGLPRAGAPRTEHVAVAYSIVDMSGKERASGRDDLLVSPPPGDAPTFFASSKTVTTLPPGKYDIRVTAQSAERNRRGGLLGEVVVPDFAKDALSMSGLFLSEVGGEAARMDELTAAIGVTPTTDRTFAASDAIAALVRLYQAKQPPAPVTMKVSIIDAHDKPAFESTDRIALDAFGQGSADYRVSLPLAKLGAGSFLLRIEASRQGAPTVKREVPFRVE
jgi:hypothetical protein